MTQTLNEDGILKMFNMLDEDKNGYLIEVVEMVQRYKMHN